MRCFGKARNIDLPDETQVVYVSPLKALSNDIRKNLQEPLCGIRALLKRNERSRDRRPRGSAHRRHHCRATAGADQKTAAHSGYHAGITVSAAHFRFRPKMLRTVRTLILDEIHAVVDDRRGAHLALSIERLAALTEAAAATNRFICDAETDRRSSSFSRRHSRSG